MDSKIPTTFLVVGGGIAGVSCIEMLSFYSPNESVVLLTESPLIKAVTNVVAMGKSLTRFDIEEKHTSQLPPNVKVVTSRLRSIDTDNCVATTDDGHQIRYKFMCLCTGGRPKIIDQVSEEGKQFVLGIRDTESVVEFQKRIRNSSRVAIVGNGGIASELVHELKNIEVEWIIKDKYISQAFVDPGAAAFLLNRVKSADCGDGSPAIFKRMRYEEIPEVGEASSASADLKGAALGPDWHTQFALTGNAQETSESVRIHPSTEIENVSVCSGEHKLKVQLKNGDEIACDVVVSATGAAPHLNFDVTGAQFRLGPDGGIFVDEFMRSSVENIYAAGDVCFAGWKWSPHWFQMRLWTQARQMGSMAGKSMSSSLAGEQIYPDFCFELFGHVTRLFGYQVVLLGKYNAQQLGRDYEALLRVTKDKEYIKYVLVDGRLQGAILIGDTGLEETTENLILNQLDLTPYGDDILNPDIDIEDYFD